MVSSVVRPLDTCCGFPQKARTSLALCIAGSTAVAVAGLGWTARWPHSSSIFSLPSLRFYGNVAFSAPLGPACSGCHSPRSGLPPARVRRLPLKERCLDKAISTQAMRQIPVDCPTYRGAAPHHFGTLRLIWPIGLPHETMEKLISPGFAPSSVISNSGYTSPSHRDDRKLASSLSKLASLRLSLRMLTAAAVWQCQCQCGQSR